MHGLTVELLDALDRAATRRARRWRAAACGACTCVPSVEPQHELPTRPLDCLDDAATKLHAGVGGEAFPRHVEELGRRHAVARQVRVQVLRMPVAGLPGVADQHAAPAAAEHQRGAEARGPAADDDRIPDMALPIHPMPSLLWVAARDRRAVSLDVATSSPS